MEDLWPANQNQNVVHLQMQLNVHPKQEKEKNVKIMPQEDQSTVLLIKNK